MYQASVLIHIISAIIWVGGLLFLALIVVPATRGLPPAERGALISALGRRFRTVGWICIGLLIITGVITSSYRGVTWQAVASGELLAGQFGRLLAVKVSLVALMVVVSLLHDTVLGPASARALVRAGAPVTREVRRLRRASSWLARASVLLGLLVVALAVALVRGLP
jgi:uncharacterized membrane protein